jgi:hypothetical protein
VHGRQKVTKLTALTRLANGAKHFCHWLEHAVLLIALACAVLAVKLVSLLHPCLVRSAKYAYRSRLA